MPPLVPAGKTYSPSSSGDDDASEASSDLPKHLRAMGRAKKGWMYFKGSLNFYRLHLLFFTFTPLIVSAIFYACNGEYHIDYIDCLFNCVSAMTVTGLATVNLSTLTGFQQAILFVLMLIGSPASVSLVMIIVRRHFFQVKFKNIVAAERERARQRKPSFGTFSMSDAASRLRRPSFLSMSGRERFRAGLAGSSGGGGGGGQNEPTSQPPTTHSTNLGTAHADGPGGELPSRQRNLWQRVRASVGLGGEGTSDSVEREAFKEAKRARKEAEKAERGRRERLEKEFGKGRIGGFGGYAGGGNGGEKGHMEHGSAGGGGGLRTSMIRRVEGEVPMLVNMAGQRGGIAIERVPTPSGAPTLPEPVAPEGGRIDVEGIDEQRDSHQGERVDTPDALTEPIVDLPRLPSNPVEPTPPAVITTPQQTSITILPGPDVRRGSTQTESAQSASDGVPIDGFPRSKTIAFDPSQVATHQHVPLHSAAGAVAAVGAATAGHGFPRTGTIEFRAGDEGLGRRHTNTAGAGFERSNTRRSDMGGRVGGAGFPRTATMRTTGARSTKHSGFGGFPMPHELLRSTLHYFFPSFERTMTRNLTFQRTATMPRTGGLGMNRTTTAASGRSYTGTINPAGNGGAPVPVPYISFDATVGRNSRFRDLTSEQMEELGGVEYRALKVLLWIVPSYLLFMQISGWVIFWPYIDAKGRYDDVFETQPRLVPIGWFAAFQSVSAFSNTGMSLVDLSMVPFQQAYLMIYYLIVLILAGNTAYPILLRFVIWALSRLCQETSRLHETCRFLLDHPRRCYIYLFPAHQTMFLLAIICLMSLVDWVSFLVLDLGTPAIEAIPIGDRISAGFLQSAAVRAAGFAIVPLNALAPAVKVLYALMMYVSVYPIAMSVRATNVYEERSLGLFEDDDEDDDDGEEAYKRNSADGKVAGWTRYLAFHARRQLAFDMWWLALALWLICIIERGQINSAQNESYFNIFSIMFELISGYGTVGLSLGAGQENFSLSGAFSTLSKLVVIAVMIRGRHRGLPVAIDRAVLLPKELLEVDADVQEELRTRQSRRSSLPSEAGRSQSDSHTRRDSTFSFTASNPGRPSRPSQPWFPDRDGTAGESALSDDDDPPLPPQVHRTGIGAGRHQVSAPLEPVKELPSAAISRNPSRENLASLPGSPLSR